jgi:argininosuccinate lyase
MLTEARLKSPPAAALVHQVHAVELSGQLDAVREFILIDLAHVLMLTSVGALDHSVGAALCKSLLSLLGPRADVLKNSDPSRGSITLQIEAHLQETCGEIGGNIQLARSRIDQNAEGMRLIDRSGLLQVVGAALSLATTQLSRAAKDANRVVPGYTHLQHSQPTTLGHYLNAHYWVTSRNVDRFLEAYERVNLSALGGAAHSGTSWPIDREMTARYLGHSGPVPNARDAGMSSLDIGADITSGLALLLSGMSRLASDLYFWSASEVRLVRLGASLCGTSSMMPQKRNPISLERIRALAGESAGWTAAQIGMMHYASSTDAEQAYVYNRVPGYCDETAGAATLQAEALEGMEVDFPRMAESAASEWSTATALADEIVLRTNLSFRDAHDVVARMVRIAEETGSRDASQLLRNAANEARLNVDFTAIDVRACLDVERFLATRTSAGGTAPAAFDALTKQAHQTHARQQRAFDEIRLSLQAATQRLLSDAKALADSA